MKRASLLLCLLLIPLTSLSAATCDGQQVIYSDDLTPLIDGYCHGQYFVPGLVSKSTYYQTPPQYFSTRALYQAEGVMEETARQKGFDGTGQYIALMPPMTSGWHAFIQMPESNEWIAVRVVDVVRRQDEYLSVVWMHSGLEMSYSLAQQLGVIDYVNANGDRYPYGVKVCICDAAPELICTGEAIDYEKWFKSILTFETRD